MICGICRTAASVTREEKIIRQYLDGRPQQILPGEVAARKMHGECRGGTWCDCQHQLPRVQVPAGT